MKRCLKALTCAVLILSTLGLVGGCGSARELNELVIVLGIGMDKGDDPGTLKVTAQIVLPSKISSSSGGGSSPSGNEEPYYNLASTGKNTFEAVREYTHLVSGRLYIAHSQVFVIGRDMAEEGIAPFLDFFVRAGETRPNTKIVISDSTAAEVLGISPKLTMLPATNLSKLIEAQMDNSQSTEATLLDYVNAMQSSAASFIAPIVKAEEREGEQTVAVSGMAVFKQDKMVGELTEDEARGVLWIKNKVKSGIINVDINGGIAALEITGAQSKVSPVVSDGKVTMKIDVSVNTVLGEQTCMENLATQEKMKELQELVKSAVCNEIAAAYQKAAALDADVFGFGDLVHKHENQDWKEMEPKWDEMFRALTLEIRVNAAIKSVGAVEEPAWYKKEK